MPVHRTPNPLHQCAITLQLSADFPAFGITGSRVLAGPIVTFRLLTRYFFRPPAVVGNPHIELFTQSTDARPEELKSRGAPGMVWRTLDPPPSRLVSGKHPLLPHPCYPRCPTGTPSQSFRLDSTPVSTAAQQHGMPVEPAVYDVVDGRRLKTRCLPARPTVVDMLSDHAFYGAR